MTRLSRRSLVCLLAFLFFFGLGAYWTQLGQSLYRNEQRFYMSELASAQAAAIERRLTRSLAATRLLAQRVRQNGGMFDGFESYADEVLRSIRGVANLQLAPEGVTRYIHPLAGNEKALGHDLLNDPARREGALQAIRERRLTLAGPFELVQGGVAVIGRTPVFLPGEQGEVFWGFASALIYLDDLLRVTELDPLGAKGYSYELSRLDPESGQEVVFSRSRTPLTQDRYAIAVYVPNGTWTLNMSRATPTPRWRSRTGYVASLLAGLLAAWIAFYMQRQPDKLRRIVTEKTQALEQLAYYDHLTGLANRRQLGEQLERVLREYPRYQQPAALMYLDLDDFKRINDSQGHDAGDLLLRTVAERLNACVRSSDLVARLGGDEFAVLLLDSESVAGVSKVAEKLLEAIERPVCLGNKSFVVSSSLGITLIPADGQDLPGILSNADMAMYSAKKSGKRNFSFYNKALQAEAMARLQLEEDLGVALAEEQLVLHFQPILALPDGELDGYEALVRWQHPQQGLLYPNQFIGIAEETGQIVPLGYWVIRAACRQISRDMRENGGSYRVAINLSPRQFKDPQLVEKIAAIVRESGVDARCLEFEVTESCIMEDVEHVIETLRALKSLGITVAIDDFGTGYSSFAQLKNLPVDRLKIDRSFVIDLETDPSDKKIVQGLVSMSHKLQLQVVAEGIETEEQLALLCRYGCDLGQGYLFSRPQPLAVVKGALEKRTQSA